MPIPPSKDGLSRISRRNVSRRTIENIRRYEKYFFVPDVEPKKESEETIERRKIHSRIQELLGLGNGKSEIVAILISEFPESKLRNFFDSYAQHHIDKKLEKEGKEDVR